MAASIWFLIVNRPMMFACMLYFLIVDLRLQFTQPLLYVVAPDRSGKEALALTERDHYPTFRSQLCG